MALNQTKLLLDLEEFFSDIDPASTAQTKALKLHNILIEHLYSLEISPGTLSSTGSGNLGAPVISSNITGGQLI